MVRGVVSPTVECEALALRADSDADLKYMSIDSGTDRSGAKRAMSNSPPPRSGHVRAESRPRMLRTLHLHTGADSPRRHPCRLRVTARPEPMGDRIGQHA